MKYFIYEDRALTAEELYQCYMPHGDIDDFKAWVLDQMEHDRIRYGAEAYPEKEQFIAMRLSDRKAKIREQVISYHVSSFHEKDKKKRKKIRDTYSRSEQYFQDCEEAYQTDPVIDKLSQDEASEELYQDFLTEYRKREGRKAEGLLKDFACEKRAEILRDMITENTLHSYEDPLTDRIRARLCDALRSETCIWDLEEEECTAEDIEAFVEGFMEDTEAAVCEYVYGDSGMDTFLDHFVLDYLFKNVPELKALKNRSAWQWAFQEELGWEIEGYKEEVLDKLQISELFLLENLMENPHYQSAAKEYYKEKRRELDRRYLSAKEIESVKRNERERRKLLGRSILSAIPKEYKDLYPLARQRHRKFILHLGPTNSGKTYHAMQALRQCGSGIYLAPLRLLAYEQFETLNRDGYACNLITGEEKNLIPDAAFQASTIEMADFTCYYQMAVIDEAQMLSDGDRGGAWTAAILGLCADTIHVCAAPYAKDILIRLIKECSDEYEIVSHERDTSLIVEKEYFRFPEDVKEKDALIVFSKKNVHAVASELQRKGRKCSIIYGNLPYDVRQEEARKFLEGQTEILVSTDAIGMGMNLPIRRVIFLETSKYDGKEKRMLKPEEIQQIAGRAGRRGMYEIGLVNSEEHRKLILNGIQAMIPPITEAVLTFPESLLGIDASLSETLERWNDLGSNEGYEKANIADQITLCRELERLTDHKQLIYEFITIPFEPDDDELKHIWLTFFKDELMGREYNYRRFLPEVYEDVHYEYLNELEEQYKICDLLYFYMERFHKEEDYQEITEIKKQISAQIMKILSRQKLVSKRCKKCGRALPWNHAFTLCDNCYHRGRADLYRLFD